MARLTFTEWLERYTKPVTAVAGLFTLVSGLVAGWAADSAVVGALVGTIILLAA